jgi:hypothetical protein
LAIAARQKRDILAASKLAMKHLQKSRRQLTLLVACLVTLGAAVFVWGLSYKLSLYDPPQASSHQMPAAKLLSSRERPRTAIAEFQEPSVATPLLIACALLALFVPLFRAKTQLSWILVRVVSQHRRPRFADIPQHAFRPPPVSR